MAAGLLSMMSLSEAIWSEVVLPAFWIDNWILPLNGGSLAVRVATRSISGRQSLPRKLLLRTILKGAVAAEDLATAGATAAPEVIVPPINVALSVAPAVMLPRSRGRQRRGPPRTPQLRCLVFPS